MTRQELIQELMQDSQTYCCYCGTPKVRFSCCGENHFETFAEMNKETQESILSDMAGEVNDFWEGYVPEPVKPAQQLTDEKGRPLKFWGGKAEQPVQQEPVALVIDGVLVKSELPEKYTGHLYTTPPQRERLAQPEQEPVAWYRDEDGIRIYYESKVWDDATPLYTSPPAQRTWVGLQDDEIYSVLENLQVMYHRPPTMDSRVIFAQAIEAKLKEKNT